MDNTTQSGIGASAGSAQTGVNNMGSTGGGNIGSDAGTGDNNAGGIGGMARNLASQAQQKAGEQVRSSVDKGRARAADTLQEVARTLMQANEGEDNPAAPYMNRAGEQVQRLAQYLQNSDMRQMVTQTEQFARRQPVLFLGTAFAIGVLAARFLKSTRDQTSGYGDSGYGMDEGLYDRERSLSSYREPDSYTAGGMGSGMSGGMAGGMSGGLGGDLAGDDSLDDDATRWPNSVGGDLGTSTDFGSSGRR